MDPIPVLTTQGTHYEVGFDIGRTFKESITKSLKDLESGVVQINANFVKDRGSEVLDGYVAVAQETYPQYVEEMQGMADGSGLPITLVYAANFWAELYRSPHRTSRFSTPEHCSDLMVNNEACMVHAHNEDGTAGMQGLGYIVNAYITDDKKRGKFWLPEEKFTAFCWPGVLPGYCFGFNSSGLTHGVNALFPFTLLEKKTPIALLTRAALAARSFEEVEMVLKDSGHGIALGISVNVGNTCQKGTRVFCNFEVAADSSSHCSILKKTVIGPPSATSICDTTEAYFHANLYKHIDVIKGKNSFGITSIGRDRRYQQFPVPQTVHDAIQIIGDTQAVENEGHLIYNEFTMATVIFDFNELTMTVYQDNPKTSTGQEQVFKLPG